MKEKSIYTFVDFLCYIWQDCLHFHLSFYSYWHSDLWKKWKFFFLSWRMKRERKNNKNQQSNTKERGNLWLELSYSLNPPLGDTISNHLWYYSIYLEGKRVLPQFLLHPVGKAWWSHRVNMHKHCGSSVYLFSPYIKAPHTKQRRALL